MTRVVLGFLVSPALLPVLTLLLGAVWSWVELVLAVSYVATLILGMPLFFLFRRLRWLEWWQVTSAGVVIALPFTLPAIRFSDGNDVPALLSRIFFGAGAALLFWLIALVRNPAVQVQSLMPLVAFSAWLALSIVATLVVMPSSPGGFFWFEYTLWFGAAFGLIHAFIIYRRRASLALANDA
jgi:hypothetical protein